MSTAFDPPAPAWPFAVQSGALLPFQRATRTRNLTWSIALGSLALAATTDSSSSRAIGHADHVMGPNGEPVEQIYYRRPGPAYTLEYYYQDFQGSTRELLTQTATVA